MAEKIVDRPINDIISESFIDYAREVIENRALPDVRDGLKPVQRRILYAMNELGLDPDKPFRKCARIVGDVLGKLHPHGDLSVYNALVNMAQPFSKRYILVEGQGNFGTIDDGPAAMRYTEARMSSLAVEMLKDLDKDTVVWQDNFDDSLKEPCVLPSALPNLLVNGTTGIAVGIASNIPPHNLGEVVEATRAFIKNPNITVKELMWLVKGPDFPTGGIVSPEKIVECYENGTGQVVVRSKVNIEELPEGKRQLVITEIPYQVSKSSLLEKTARYIENRKEDDVLEIRDESDQSGIRVIIEMDRGGNAEKLLEELFSKTELQVNFSYNMVALVGGKPVTLSLKQMISAFVEHRAEIVKRRTLYDLNKARARKHILDGLVRAVGILDDIIKTIRKSASPKEAKENLIKKFSFSNEQAQAILDIRLQRLTALEIKILKKEMADIEKAIARFEAILSSEKNILKEVDHEIALLGEKYQDERKTTVKDFDKIEIKTKIEKFTLQIAPNGKIKKLSDRYSGDRGISIKTDTTKTIWLFESGGNILKYTGIALPQTTDKKIVGACNEGDLISKDSIIFVASDGQIKKSSIGEYENIKGDSLAIKLGENASLVGVLFKAEEADGVMLFEIDCSIDIILVTKNGFAIRFNDADIRQIGRVAAGVRGISLEKDDEVAGFLSLPYDKEKGNVVLDTDQGEVSVRLTSIRKQNRGGKGLRILRKQKIKEIIKLE